MRKRNGFTLVELLAVIVVLAILMIVAFPAILDVMNDAKKQNMALMAEKMMKDAQQKFTYDLEYKSEVKTARKATYQLKEFGYANTGSYQGCVKATRTSGKDKYEVYIYDDDFAFNNEVGEGATNKDWNSTNVLAKDDSKLSFSPSTICGS